MDRRVSGQAGRRTHNSPNQVYSSDRIVVPQRLIQRYGVERALLLTINQVIRNTELRHGEYALR